MSGGNKNNAGANHPNIRSVVRNGVVIRPPQQNIGGNQGAQGNGNIDGGNNNGAPRANQQDNNGNENKYGNAGEALGANQQAIGNGNNNNGANNQTNINAPGATAGRQGNNVFGAAAAPNNGGNVPATVGGNGVNGNIRGVNHGNNNNRNGSNNGNGNEDLDGNLNGIGIGNVGGGTQPPPGVNLGIGGNVGVGNLNSLDGIGNAGNIGNMGNGGQHMAPGMGGRVGNNNNGNFGGMDAGQLPQQQQQQQQQQQMVAQHSFIQPPPRQQQQQQQIAIIYDRGIGGQDFQSKQNRYNINGSDDDVAAFCLFSKEEVLCAVGQTQFFVDAMPSLNIQRLMALAPHDYDDADDSDNKNDTNSNTIDHKISMVQSLLDMMDQHFLFSRIGCTRQ